MHQRAVQWHQTTLKGNLVHLKWETTRRRFLALRVPEHWIQPFMDTKHTRPVPCKNFLLPPHTSFKNLDKHPHMLFCTSFNSLLLLYMTHLCGIQSNVLKAVNINAMSLAKYSENTKLLWGVCMTIKPSHYASIVVEVEQQNDQRGSEWSGLLRTTDLKRNIQIFLPLVAGQ
jgi:hypothetical protein